MAKIIVTHAGPDLDALTSIWLLRRFLPGWERAKVNFVTAGETFRGAPPDADPEIVHVDTGFGRLDHHQKKEYNSAANLCLGKISKERDLKKVDREALKRLVVVVTEIDNGRDISWPETRSDRYEFMPHIFLINMPTGPDLVDLAMIVLDKIFQALKNKIRAEKTLKEEGQVCRTRWGKAVAVATGNDQVLQEGQREGFVLIAKQDPKSGHLRIYGRFDKKVDLTRAYKEVKKKDPAATWYLHTSCCLLLNGSRHNPKMVPTKLSLDEIISILKKA